MTELLSQHNMQDTRYFTAASPLELPPHVQSIHWRYPLKWFLPLLDGLCGLFD